MHRKKNNKNENKTDQKYDDYRGCVISNKILADGMKVGFMYRETPDEDVEKDTGWRFLSGTETDEYLDDIDNYELRSLQIIIEKDPAVLPYLKMPVGTELERVENNDEFIPLTE